MEQKEKVYLTLGGLKKLKDEYEKLVEEGRPRIARRIKNATGEGSVEGNSEFESAQEASLVLERRIAELEETLKRAVLIDGRNNGDGVGLGSTVTVEHNGQNLKFTLVGSAEANPLEGKISNESPLGKKLLGSKKGKVIEIREKEVTYKVVSIS